METSTDSGVMETSTDSGVSDAGQPDSGGCKSNCITGGTCGAIGCDAVSGACMYPPATTTCGAPPSCANGVQTTATTCNGSGACSAATTTTCTPYMCGATTCKTACATDSDCVSGDYCTGDNCNAGACQPQPYFAPISIPGVPQPVIDLGNMVAQQQRDVVTPGGSEFNPGFSAADQARFESSCKLATIVAQVTASQTFKDGVVSIKTLTASQQATVFEAYNKPIFPTWAMNGYIGQDGTTDAGYAVENEIATALAGAVKTAVTFTLIWHDEFGAASGTGVDTSNWLYDTGTCYPGCPAAQWGTGELETMSSSTSNVYQDGSGHLVIKPIRDSNGWTSGRIETRRTDFQPPAGGILAVEASIQQPNVSGAAAAGYWPAFWMLGAPFRGVYTNWPSIGEIDIMEDRNGLTSEFATFHCGTSPGGPCNEPNGIGSGELSFAGLQTGFHAYRVELDFGTSPQQIRFSLDAKQLFTVNANQVDSMTWNSVTQNGFFIILNVAMGGDFPGAPTSSTVSGVPMLVDYIRVYTSI
jgi:beta-glucanase (GH16 family)